MNDEELQIYRLHVGSGPLIATAVHDGHDIRPDLLQFVGLPEADRLREEDPFTGLWTTAAPTRVVATRSRFEVDLNRPRETCAYREPADCWGLRLYSKTPPTAQFERSIAEYDDFYGGMHDLLTDVAREHKRFVVYDFHSYNHRREGPDGPEADAETNPQVNLGTESIDRKRWGGVVDAFVGSLRSYDYPGGHLDVRENVKFKGGAWPRWINQNFPDSGVAIAIEFKKFFMDEWSGDPDRKALDDITESLRSTIQPVLTALATT